MLDKIKPLLSGLIIGAMIGAILFYFFWPKPDPPAPVTIATYDSAAVQDAVDRYKKTSDAKISFLKGTILGLEEKLEAKGGNTSRPSISPLTLTPINFDRIRQYNIGRFPNTEDMPRDSTVPIYNYDFIIGGWISSDELQFLTLNPFAELNGNNYIKTYLFDRPTSNFEFASTKNPTPGKLDGISIVANQTFMRFNIYIGTGFKVPLNYYGTIEGRFTFYNVVEIVPYLKPSLFEQPQIGAELRLKL